MFSNTIHSSQAPKFSFSTFEIVVKMQDILWHILPLVADCLFFMCLNSTESANEEVISENVRFVFSVNNHLF